MIVTRLKVPLEQAEYSALLKVAVGDLRSPADQVRHILRQELERRGLLAVEPQSLKEAQSVRGGQEGKNASGA